MRTGLVVLLLAAAVWQGWVDWQATIGEGYAYRLTSIGTALQQASPERYAAFVAAGESGALAWAWDPVGRTLMRLPLALVLLMIAGALWVTRRKSRGY